MGFLKKDKRKEGTGRRISGFQGHIGRGRAQERLEAEVAELRFHIRTGRREWREEDRNIPDSYYLDKTITLALPMRRRQFLVRRVGLFAIP